MTSILTRYLFGHHLAVIQVATTSSTPSYQNKPNPGNSKRQITVRPTEQVAGDNMVHGPSAQIASHMMQDPRIDQTLSPARPMRIKERGAVLTRNRLGVFEAKAKKRNRVLDVHGCQKRQRFEYTLKSIHYDAVHQNKRAVKKHVIIREPPDSTRPGKFYILRCDQHDLSFDNDPIKAASSHLKAEHRHWSSSSESVIQHFGYEVIGCDDLKLDVNNKVAKQAFEKGSDRQARDCIRIRGPSPQPDHNSEGKGVNHSRPKCQSKDDLSLVPSRVYIVYWAESRKWITGVLLPTYGPTYISTHESVENMWLLDNLPPCYQYDTSTMSISWAQGYGDDGPERSEPFFAFLLFQGFKFPGECHRAWIPIQNIHEWNEDKAKAIEHSQQAIDYIRKTERRRPSNYGSDDEIPGPEAEDDSLPDLTGRSTLEEYSTYSQPVQSTEALVIGTAKEVELTGEAEVREHETMVLERVVQTQGHQSEKVSEGLFMDTLDGTAAGVSKEHESLHDDISQEAITDTPQHIDENATSQTVAQTNTHEESQEIIPDTQGYTDENAAPERESEITVQKKKSELPREPSEDVLPGIDLEERLSQPEQRAVVGSSSVPNPIETFKTAEATEVADMESNFMASTQNDSQVQVSESPRDEVPQNCPSYIDMGRTSSQSEAISNDVEGARLQIEPAARRVAFAAPSNVRIEPEQLSPSPTTPRSLTNTQDCSEDLRQPYAAQFSAPSNPLVKAALLNPGCFEEPKSQTRAPRQETRICIQPKAQNKDLEPSSKLPNQTVRATSKAEFALKPRQSEQPDAIAVSSRLDSEQVSATQPPRQQPAMSATRHNSAIREHNVTLSQPLSHQISLQLPPTNAFWSGSSYEGQFIPHQMVSTYRSTTPTARPDPQFQLNHSLCLPAVEISQPTSTLHVNLASQDMALMQQAAMLRSQTSSPPEHHSPFKQFPLPPQTGRNLSQPCPVTQLPAPSKFGVYEQQTPSMATSSRLPPMGLLRTRTYAFQGPGAHGMAHQKQATEGFPQQSCDSQGHPRPTMTASQGLPLTQVPRHSSSVYQQPPRPVMGSPHETAASIPLSPSEVYLKNLQRTVGDGTGHSHIENLTIIDNNISLTEKADAVIEDAKRERVPVILYYLDKYHISQPWVPDRFLIKLRFLRDKKNDVPVRWSQDGDSFIIQDESEVTRRLGANGADIKSLKRFLKRAKFKVEEDESAGSLCCSHKYMTREHPVHLWNFDKKTRGKAGERGFTPEKKINTVTRQRNAMRTKTYFFGGTCQCIDQCGSGCSNLQAWILCDDKTCNVDEDRCQNRWCSNKKGEANSLVGSFAIKESTKCGKELVWDGANSILPRTKLLRYSGKLLGRLDLYHNRQGNDDEITKGHYVVKLKGSEVFLDAGKQDITAKFANHSCSPNCRLEDWSSEGGQSLFLVSSGEIRNGDPLTFEYDTHEAPTCIRVRFGEKLYNHGVCFCFSKMCKWRVDDEGIEKVGQWVSEQYREKRCPGDIPRTIELILPRTDKVEIVVHDGLRSDIDRVLFDAKTKVKKHLKEQNIGGEGIRKSAIELSL